MKCQSCEKEIINPEIELHKQEQHDRLGNVKTNKKGDILYYNFHESCWVFKEKEKKAKDGLNQYLKSKFFVLEVPHIMWQYLIGFRNGGDKFNTEKKKHQGYPFEIMHESLLKVEDDLNGLYQKMQNENQFTDDTHRINLIIKYMCKNLDTVYGEYKLKQQKEKQQETKKEIINTATDNANFVAPKSKNKLILNDFVT